MGYKLDRDSEFFEYRMVIRTTDKTAMEKLVASLRTVPEVVEFRISPTGD
jgi:putative Mg2+ transporter-C (MgtC) family protein